MKRMIAITFILVGLCAMDAAPDVVRNRSYQQEAIDSIPMGFDLIDTFGNTLELASADTIIIQIFYPGGLQCYQSVILTPTSSGLIYADTAETGSTDRYSYVYANQVSDIDGDGRLGQYSYKVLVIDASLALETGSKGRFTVYDKSQFAQWDSATAALTQEHAHRIADSRGKVLVPDTSPWWMRTGLVGDSITTDAGNGDPVEALYGDNAITIWCSDTDSTVASVKLDTLNIDPRNYSTFTFWVQVLGDHPHEGQCPGPDCTGDAQDSATAFGELTFWISPDGDSSAIDEYYYIKFDDMALMRGWNKLIFHVDEMTSQGGATWSEPMLYCGFNVSADSSGADIWVTIDDIRFNKRSDPVFLLRFDDSPRSVLTHAFPILNDYGSASSVFVNGFRVLGVDTGVGNLWLSLGDLRTLYEAGWDISNHGWDASTGGDYTLPMGGTSLYNDRQQINSNQEFLLDAGFMRGAGFFTYPYDGYDEQTINVLMERHDFACGGKSSMNHDHLMQDEPPGTEVRRFVYPFMNYWQSPATGADTSQTIDTLKNWVDMTVKRGNLLIINFHGMLDHFHDTLECNVDDTPEEWSRASDPDSGSNSYKEINELTANDADYIYADNSQGTGLLTTMVGVEDPNTSEDPVDSVTITWRLKATAAFTAAQQAATDSQAVYLKIDTGNGDETVATFSNTDTIPPDWTEYTYIFKDITLAKIDAMEVGVEVEDGGDDFGGTVYCSWINPRAGDELSVAYNADSSVIRALCEYIDSYGYKITTFTDYFLTQGGSSRITKILDYTEEARDSVVSLDADIQNIVDSLYAVIDSLQSQDDWVAKETSVTAVRDKTDQFSFTSGDVDANVETWRGSVPYDLTGSTVQSNTLTISDNAITAGALSTAAQDKISDGVWEEARSGHTTPGSFGAGVDTAIAGVDNLVIFFGACDGCWYEAFPSDGSANKDSIYFYNPAIGADSLDGRIVYYHSNVPAVYDSARFDRGPAPFPAP